MSQIIHTDQAPAAIGPYSQAVRAGNTVYFSGQIPLDPATGEIVPGDIGAQARRCFDNLKAVAEAAGGSLDKIVRLGLYLTDLGQFAAVNAVMQEYFQAPFPARSTIEVSGLPKGAGFEVDAVMAPSDPVRLIRFDLPCHARSPSRRAWLSQARRRCPACPGSARKWPRSSLRVAFLPCRIYGCICRCVTKTARG